MIIISSSAATICLADDRDHLKHVLEYRKSVLKKEEAMAYDDAFGASRLK